MGSDETVALTAFVVIALHHGLAVFPEKNSEQLRRVVRQLCVCSLLMPFPVRSPVHRPLPHIHFLPGKFHLKSKHLLGGESNLWAPGCPRLRHHGLRPVADRGP